MTVGVPRRIALLHLESLACLPALDRLFAALGGRIGFVVSSDRFGADGRSFWRETSRHVCTSGWRLPVALGFDMLTPSIAAWLMTPLRAMGVAPRLHTLRQHADRVQGVFISAAQINDPRVIDLLRAYRPDLIICLHFDQILDDAFISGIGAPILNIHPSLLPRHRGPCPTFWSLYWREAVTGVSVHRVVDRTIDSGEILAQAVVPVGDDVTVKELDAALFVEGVGLLLGLFQQTAAPPSATTGVRHPITIYESFPTAAAVGTARAAGVRFWRLSQIVNLLAAMLGMAAARKFLFGRPARISCRR
jgi:hypothetical protein